MQIKVKLEYVILHHDPYEKFLIIENCPYEIEKKIKHAHKEYLARCSFPTDDAEFINGQLFVNPQNYGAQMVSKKEYENCEYKEYICEFWPL